MASGLERLRSKIFLRLNLVGHSWEARCLREMVQAILRGFVGIFQIGGKIRPSAPTPLRSDSARSSPALKALLGYAYR